MVGKETLVKKKFVEVLKNLAESQNITLPTLIQEHIPQKWEKHGDLVLFPQGTFEDNIWSCFDKKLLWIEIAKFLKVQRLAKQDRIQSNCFRSPKVSMILGSDPWVVHIDNKIKYSFNVTKCMFSSGNITEKMRMATLDCSDEIVVDMFAGIGYFTLPLLVHAKAKHVFACEWNPDAIEALKKNTRLNKVSERCTILEGDNRKVISDDIKADRILMGLIPTAEMSYEAACKTLNPISGGWIHIHGNVDSAVASNCEKYSESNQLPSCNKTLTKPWMYWSLSTRDKIENILKLQTTKDWNVKIKHIERVKSYAPRVDHLVVDLNCIPLN